MKATVKFGGDWTETLSGDLAQGGELAVDYDLSRLPQYRTHYREAAVWDIIALKDGGFASAGTDGYVVIHRHDVHGQWRVMMPGIAYQPPGPPGDPRARAFRMQVANASSALSAARSFRSCSR